MDSFNLYVLVGWLIGAAAWTSSASTLSHGESLQAIRDAWKLNQSWWQGDNPCKGWERVLCDGESRVTYLTPATMVETKILRQHRKIICDALILYLYLASEDHIRRAFDPLQSKFNDFVTELVEHCWAQLCAAFSSTFDSTLRTNGVMHNVVKQLLGQLVRSLDSLTNQEIKAQPGIRERMQLISQLHSEVKDKSKAESSSKRPRIEENICVASSEESLMQPSQPLPVDEHSLPPILHLLSDFSIFHMQAPQLGEGRYAVVKQVSVAHPLFKDLVYAAKIFKDQTGGKPTLQIVLEEATAITVQHPGMILPHALVRHSRKPMLIFRLWNGGTLEQWIQACHHDGSRPAIKEFQHTSGTVDQFMDNILSICNSLLKTMIFLHSHDFIHNDLHTRNVLLHFGSKGVYAGIADWGQSTPSTTQETFRKLLNFASSTRALYERDYPWTAPENISTNPPPFTKASDVYSVSYLLKCLIGSIAEPSEAPKREFLRNVNKHLIAGKSFNPTHRPKMWDLGLYLNGACNVGYPIVSTFGLRPSDD